MDGAASAGEFGEVALDVGDLVADGDDVGVVEQGGQAALVVRVQEVGVLVLEALEGGGGRVVFLAYGGAGAGLGDQFLLRQEEVDLQ